MHAIDFHAASKTAGHLLHLRVCAYKKTRQHPDMKQGIKTPLLSFCVTIYTFPIATSSNFPLTLFLAFLTSGLLILLEPSKLK